MKVNVLPEVIRPQLSRCAKIASFDSKGNLKPVYGYVSITTTGNMVNLRVQDAHVHFEANLLADSTEQDGTALVECDKFLSILKTRLDGHPVQLSIENEFLLLKQGEFRAKLPQLKGESIPPLPPQEKPYDFVIDFEPKMWSATNRCGVVVEDEKSDSPFKGLLFDFQEEKTIRIAGFSQALLHVARFDLPETGGFRVSVAQRVLPLFDSLSGNLPMKLAFDRHNMRVVCTSSENSVSVRCVEDTYPKGYVELLGLHKMQQGVFPITKLTKEGKIAEEIPRKQLKFRREEFMQALGSAACILGREDNAVEVIIKNKTATGQYVVEMVGLNRFTKAKATEKILAESNLDSTLSIGIHHQKVREALRLMQSDFFTAHVGGPADVIVLTEEGNIDLVSFSVPLR